MLQSKWFLLSAVDAAGFNFSGALAFLLYKHDVYSTGYKFIHIYLYLFVFI